MKVWLRVVLEFLAVILLVPQAFVYLYFFRFLFTGGNWPGLLKTFFLYGVTISWVSAPFLVALALLIKALISVRVRWYVTLLLCTAAGYLWVAVWNRLIYDVFSYAQSALPILLCSVGFAGYAVARSLYLASLPPSEPAGDAGRTDRAPSESTASDLSE